MRYSSIAVTRYSRYYMQLTVLAVLLAYSAVYNSAQAQKRLRLVVHEAGVTGCGGCDGGLFSSDNDHRWSWEDGIGGTITDRCHSGGERNPNYTDTFTDVLFDETYNCPSDWPTGNINYTWYVDEADGACGCLAGQNTCSDNSVGQSWAYPASGTGPSTINLPQQSLGGGGDCGCVTYTYRVRWEVSGAFIPEDYNNDMCNAGNLGTLTLGGSLTMGGQRNDSPCDDCQGGEPNCSNDPTVWYRFTTGATVATAIDVEIDATGGGLDAWVGVYTDPGNCNTLNDLVQIQTASSVPNPFGTSDATATLDCPSPNTTYWIQVDGLDVTGSAGTFTVNINDNGFATPTNDQICGAINLGTLPFGGSLIDNNLLNICATTQAGEPNAPSCLFGIDQTIWVRFQTGAQVGHETDFLSTSDPNNNGDDIDLQIAVYTSSNGLCTGSFSEVDCDYDPDVAPFFSGEDMTIKCLEPNTTYWVQLDGSFINTQGFIGLRIDDSGVPQAPNDLVCSPTPLGTIPNGGTITRTNENNYCAGVEVGEADPLSHGLDQTVWYTFTPPSSGSVEIELLNNGSDNIDLQVACWEVDTDTCTGFFAEVDSYDDLLSFSISGTNAFRLKCLDTTKTYFLQVDGAFLPLLDNHVGDFDLIVRDYNVSPAPHDSICNAIFLGDPSSGPIFLNNQNNFCANNINEPIPSCFGTNQTVWYRFIAPTTGRVTIDLQTDPNNVGDDIDLQVAVFCTDGDSCAGAIMEVGCDYNDLLEFPPLSRDEEILVTCLEPGRPYWIMVDGDDSHTDKDGFFSLELTMEPGPAPITNDSICNAIPLGPVPAFGSVTTGEVHNFCAGIEAGEPVPNAFGIDQTVWFTFIAPPSGNVTLDLNTDPLNRGDDIDLQVAVYASDNNTCTGNMEEVGSDYFPVILDEDLTVTCLEPGREYWVQVDGALLPPAPLTPVLVEGYFEMTISEDPAFVPMPTNDSICNHVNLGVVPTGLGTPVFSGSNFCATTENGEPNVDNCSFFFNFICDETVWFTFTTNNNPGTITVDVFNTSGIDANITVYQATNFPSCSFNDLLYLGDADNLISFDVSLDLPCLPPNTTFFVQVDGGDLLGNYGTFDIQVTDDAVPQAIPPNDSICNAVNFGVIASGGATPVTPGSNICAREEPLELNTSQLLNITDPLYDETVWYEFTTNATPGLYTIAVTNVQGGLQPSITCYRNDNPPSCAYGDLTEVDDATALLPGGNVSLNLDCLEPNTTYYIQLDGLDIIGDNGTFDIQVIDDGNPHLVPVNDDICNATNLGNVPVGGSTPVTASHNFCATTESGEPQVSGCTILNDPLCDETVWFTFTTPATPGLTTITVNNTVGIDASINVYSGAPSCAFNSLTRIDGQDNLLSSDVSLDIACLTPNTTYYVQVDGVDIIGDEGTFDIRVSDDGSMNSYAPNDSICNATPLGVVPFNGSTATISSHNFCATTEPSEPNVDNCPVVSSLTCDETVWFTFTTSATPGEITVAITNTVGIDANIDVYRVSPASSCNFNDLTHIASADNLISFDVSVDLPCLPPNTTYYVQVDGNDIIGDNGTFDITVSDNGTFVGTPVNDDLCNAIYLGDPNGGSVGPTAGTNDCATEQPLEQNVNGDDETVWYTFIAPASGSAEIIITSITGIDANFTLYHDDGQCGFDSLTQVGSNHDDLLSFSVDFTEDCLIPRDTYYIQIDGGDIFGDYGDFTVTVIDDNPTYSGPSNDPCSGAIPLPIGNEPCQGSGNWNVFQYNNPTVSLNDAFTQGCGQNCGDVWFCFTMPPSGVVLLEGNDELDTLLGVPINNSNLTVAAYQGPCSNLQPIQCDQGGLFDDPQYYIQGTPGTKIYLQVFDDGGDDLDEDFGLCLTDRCGSDSCQTATPMQTGIWYCWDTDGATGESFPSDPGYLECGDGSDPGASVYFAYTNMCESFTITVQGSIGGTCIASVATDGIGIALISDATPCDWNPDALVDCEITDACLGNSYFFQKTYSAPVGTPFIIQIDGFDLTGNNNGQIRIDENCVLDVAYSRFIGYRSDEVHELEWSVSEPAVTSGYFEVEKSLDGENFEQIGRVNGRDYVSNGGGASQGGSSEETYDYALTDYDPVAGHNFYRLRFVDQNGLETYSDVIDIYFDEGIDLQIVGLYPNPAREVVNMDAYVSKAGTYELQVVDIYGKVAIRSTLNLEEGLNKSRFRLDALSAGVYVVVLRNVDDNASAHQKFIKQ